MLVPSTEESAVMIGFQTFKCNTLALSGNRGAPETEPRNIISLVCDIMRHVMNVHLEQLRHVYACMLICLCIACAGVCETKRTVQRAMCNPKKTCFQTKPLENNVSNGDVVQ